MAASKQDFKALHRVLIVEDNASTAALLEFLFDRAGYDVLIAENGRDAQEMLITVEPADLMLLDLMLPYVSGYQVLCDARESIAWCDIPILVLSGKALEGDVVNISCASRPFWALR